MDIIIFSNGLVVLNKTYKTFFWKPSIPVLKCIIFNFDIFLFQPLTVEIFVEEDFVEEDVENWT